MDLYADYAALVDASVGLLKTMSEDINENGAHRWEARPHSHPTYCAKQPKTSPAEGFDSKGLVLT